MYLWKLQGFPIIQILCETKFGEGRSSKAVIFAIQQALNFVCWVNFSLQKVQKLIKVKIQSL